MALCPYLLLIHCIVIAAITGTDTSYLANNITTSETTTTKLLPNDNIGSNSDVILITTFFDLLWYIVGLIVFSICCISCLVLFYIQQARKHDNKQKNSMSESIQETQTTLPSTASGTVHRKSTLSTASAISISSITKSPTKSPQFPPSLPTLTHSKNFTYSNYSLSAFSGVDSEGVDLEETVNAFSEYNNVFSSLPPISEDINSDKRNINSDEETMDDDTKVEDSTESTESSIDSGGNMTILAMMKKRALKSPPVPCHRNNTKYKNKYGRTVASETRDFEQEIV